MKIKLLLATTTLALAALFSNCTKDNSIATQASPEQISEVRGSCDIVVITPGNLQICGTHTNTVTCSGTTGQVNVGAGTYTYSLDKGDPLVLTNVNGSNPCCDGINVQVGQVGGSFTTHYILGGTSKTFTVDSNCDPSDK